MKHYMYEIKIRLWVKADNMEYADTLARDYKSNLLMAVLDDGMEIKDTDVKDRGVFIE